RFQDFGGWDGNFVVSGIEISAGGLPAEAPLLAAGNPLDSAAASIATADLTPVMAKATSDQKGDITDIDDVFGVTV
ncbi:MAG: hypothetical protein R6X17_08955, partial [Candidatus Competibacteraceae bacterium]